MKIEGLKGNLFFSPPFSYDVLFLIFFFIFNMKSEIKIKSECKPMYSIIICGPRFFFVTVVSFMDLNFFDIVRYVFSLIPSLREIFNFLLKFEIFLSFCTDFKRFFQFFLLIS